VRGASTVRLVSTWAHQFVRKKEYAIFRNRRILLSEASLSRIVMSPLICGGRPTIGGTRIRASDIVEMLANGATEAEILMDFDELKLDDIREAMLFAARSIGHHVLRVI
jgi:uncharacterized protein (DUF433 family)